MQLVKSSFLLIKILTVTLLFTAAYTQCYAAKDYETLLSEIEKNVKDIKTVKSFFSEEKHISMLKKPLISEGFFIFEAPDRLRWEYTKPYSSGFTLNETSGTLWDSSQNIHKKYTLQSDPLISGIAKQLILWTSFNRKAIESDYHIKLDGSKILELTPINEATRNIVSKIRLSVSENTDSVDSVEIYEKNGDYMSIKFYNKEFNISYDKAIFE